MGRYPWLSNSVLARNGRRVPCRRGVTKDQNPWEPRDSTACRQKTGFPKYNFGARYQRHTRTQKGRGYNVNSSRKIRNHESRYPREGADVSIFSMPIYP